MRSDEWDKKEAEPFDGMQRRNPTEHQHEFNDDKCIHCGKTREQIRSEW